MDDQTPVPEPPADTPLEPSVEVAPVETPATEPPVAPPAEIPSPAPAPVESVPAEPAPEPTHQPEPIVVPEPVIIPEPSPEPITVPEPAPAPVIKAPAPEPPAPAPAPPVTPPPPAAEIDISQLSDAQLKAAASLYAKKNQASLSRQGVEARQAVAQKNVSDILAFISSHSPASNRTIARALNLPPRRVQHYMQLLTHRGDVAASGWGVSREYRIK